MLRLLTTADTEVLAAAHAVRELGEDFPEVRAAGLVDDVDEFVAGARVVVVRLLGGGGHGPRASPPCAGCASEMGSR
jgi:cobaltochelatase CobN